MTKTDEAWLEDGSFKEFAPGTVSGFSPVSSGMNIFVAGGQISWDAEEIDPDENIPIGVLLYQQELDTGKEMLSTLTPEAARELAQALLDAADAADEQEGCTEEAGVTAHKVINDQCLAWNKSGKWNLGSSRINGAVEV